MRTPDIEGVAIHDGPESCVGDPRGRSEALTGVRVGRLLSREITCFGVSTPSRQAEGHIAGGVSASRLADPARSENLCMHGVLVCENREIPLLARPVDHRPGRSGNAEAVSLG
jgi:hypothetical protein